VIGTFEQYGFAMVSNVFSRSDSETLSRALGLNSGAGRRGLLAVPAVAEISRSEKVLKLVRPHVGDRAKPVRAIYFDKSQDANWLVAWHQDLTIAVQSRVDVPGFGPWSTKDGVPHVQAPVAILERMLAVRIHFDDCDETNGALRVLPGTQRLGRLSSERIQELRSQVNEIVCCASAGDVMLMRPLLLHASSKSGGNGHRRVLHIEYAGFELPGGLQWRAA